MRSNAGRHPLCKPLSPREQLQVYNELQHYKQHGYFSETATLRVKMRVRRICRSNQKDSHKEQTERLIRSILRNTETND